MLFILDLFIETPFHSEIMIEDPIPASLSNADDQLIFCNLLKAHSYCILHLDDDSSFDTLQAFRHRADCFFKDGSIEDRSRLMKECMNAEFRSTDDYEIVDFKFDLKKSITDVQDFIAWSNAWARCADKICRHFLSILARHIDIPVEALIKPLTSSHDHPANASVLRVTHYNAASIGFPMHTDTTLLTLSPFGSQVGLEYLDPSCSQWTQPEKISQEIAANYDANRLLLVHVGDLLTFLTKGYFQPAIHHVIASTKQRIGAPYLLRVHENHELNTSQYHTQRQIDNLIEIEDVSYTHVKKLLDTRGQKLGTTYGKISDTRRYFKQMVAKKAIQKERMIN